MNQPVDPARQCTAKSKRSGDRCRRWAMPGAAVCYFHGAASPQARQAATRRLEQARVAGEVAALVAEMDPGPDVDPLVVLLDAVRTSSSMRAALARLVGELEDRPSLDVVDGTVVSTTAALYGPDHLGDLRRHPLEAMLADWTDRAARHSKLALDAGVEERQVRIAERTGEAFAAAIGAIESGIFAALEAAGCDTDVLARVRRDEAPAIVRRELLAIDAASSSS